MEGVWPHSTSADLESNPAKRPRLQLDHPAQHDLEGPMETSSNWLPSIVFLPSGSALQLTLDDCDLLLEPQPTSILEVALPGHNILLVPEGLQDSTSSGHPEFLPSDPLDSALLDMPRELIVIQPGSFSDSVRDSKGLQNTSHSGMAWMEAPASLVPGLHLSSSHFRVKSQMAGFLQSLLEQRDMLPGLTGAPKATCWSFFHTHHWSLPLHLLLQATKNSAL